MNRKALKKVGIFGCIIVAFIALLYAANNFIFTSKYDYKNTTMYVSRGLGNSIIPIRIFIMLFKTETFSSCDF